MQSVAHHAVFFCLGALVFGFLLAPAQAKEDPPVKIQNIRIWFGELEGGQGDAPLSLQVSGGGRVLFTTAPSPASDARWRHSVRVFTAREQPLVFRVLKGAPAPSKAPPAPSYPSSAPDESDQQRIRRQDQMLDQAFDDLVGDMGLPEARQALGEDLFPAPRPTPPSSSTRPRRQGGVVACRAELSWPPVDGAHRLECGSMTLTVKTKRLPDKAR